MSDRRFLCKVKERIPSLFSLEQLTVDNAPREKDGRRGSVPSRIIRARFTLVFSMVKSTRVRLLSSNIFITL